MDTSSQIIMYLGFAMAAYSVVGNDVIQTLGTFLTSNEKRPWYLLWGYAATILTVVLVYGWIVNDGDVSYMKLIGNASKGYSFANPAYPLPNPLTWWYLLPPIILLVITRFGIPVSTTFLILTFFGTASLSNFDMSRGFGEFLIEFFTADQFSSMLTKSLLGYAVASITAIIAYTLIAEWLERRFYQTELEGSSREGLLWSAAQWVSTGFLWSQWLIQDFANIYAYLPRKVSVTEMIASLVVILGLLAYIFYQRGGAIQGIVKSKTNTQDIRSATIIDFIYGIVLFFFKELNDVPMSTTWVFIGLLAGREYALRYRFDDKKISRATHKGIGLDAMKATLGLVVSIILVVMMQYVRGL